jgi:hypothetical protein
MKSLIEGNVRMCEEARADVLLGICGGVRPPGNQRARARSSVQRLVVILAMQDISV